MLYDRRMDGTELRTRRLALGLTQPQLATKLGLSKRRIQQYEAGDRIPRAVEMALIVVAQEQAGDAA